MSVLDPRQGLLALVFLVVSVVGFNFWEARLVSMGDEAGYSRAKAEYSAAALKAQDKARADTARMQKEKDDADQRWVQRLAAKSRAADRLLAERDRLRGSLDAARANLRTAPLEAVREYARTATDVFEQCSRRYSEVAQAADGHSADSLKLQEAWPRP